MTEIQIIRRIRQATYFRKYRHNSKTQGLSWYDYKAIMKRIENLIVQDIEKGKNTIPEAEELLIFAERLLDDLQ